MLVKLMITTRPRASVLGVEETRDKCQRQVWWMPRLLEKHFQSRCLYILFMRKLKVKESRAASPDQLSPVINNSCSSWQLDEEPVWRDSYIMSIRTIYKASNTSKIWSYVPVFTLHCLPVLSMFSLWLTFLEKRRCCCLKVLTSK